MIAALRESPHEGLSLHDLCRSLNLSKNRIQKTLKILSLESPAPVAKRDAKWLPAAANLGEGFWERAHRLTRLRRAEQIEMQEYVKLESEHMKFLVQALDGDAEDIESLNLPQLRRTVSRANEQKAVEFVRGRKLEIPPRKRWPTGGMPKFKV